MSYSRLSTKRAKAEVLAGKPVRWSFNYERRPPLWLYCDPGVWEEHREDGAYIFSRGHVLCQKHPKYLAIREPRCLCRACWRAFFKENPELLRGP